MNRNAQGRSLLYGKPLGVQLTIIFKVKSFDISVNYGVKDGINLVSTIFMFGLSYNPLN